MKPVGENSRAKTSKDVSEGQASRNTADAAPYVTGLHEIPNHSPVQATLGDTVSTFSSTAQSLAEPQSQDPAYEPTIDSSGQQQQQTHSHYRTVREREMNLAIPTRKARSITSSTNSSIPSGQYTGPRTRSAAAKQRESSPSGRQVMNPLWLATSTSRTRAEKRAASMLSDAKAELMLVAARKIGKKRVGMAAGFMSAQIAEAQARHETLEDLGSRGKGKGKERVAHVERRLTLQDHSILKEAVRRSTHDVATPTSTPVKKKTLNNAITMRPGMSNLSFSMWMLIKLSCVTGSSVSTPPGSRTGYYAPIPGMSPLVYFSTVHTAQGMNAASMQVPHGTNPVPVFVPVGGWPSVDPSPGVLTIPTSNITKDGGANSNPLDASPSRSNTQATPTLQRSDSQGLDSLLSAARMLEDDEISESSGIATPTRVGERVNRTSNSTRSRRSDAVTTDEAPATPVAKRRRVTPGRPASVTSLGDTTPVQSPTPKGRGSTTLAKVSSALDVLADQAAQEQERRPSAGPSTPRRGPETNTQPRRAPGRRRQSGGRTRASDGTSSKLSNKGKSKTTVQEGSERHSSPEVELSRKRRRSASGVEPGEEDARLSGRPYPTSTSYNSPPPKNAPPPRLGRIDPPEGVPLEAVSESTTAAPFASQLIDNADLSSLSDPPGPHAEQTSTELGALRESVPLSDTDALGSPDPESVIKGDA